MAPHDHLAKCEALIEAGRRVSIVHERSDLVDRLDQARASLGDATLSVVVVGEFKQGKSSLVNALVNADICPVDDDIASAVTMVLNWHAEPQARLHRRGDAAPVRVAVPVATDAARGVLPEVTDVHTVEVGVPRQLLRRGLRLIDTPGTGGAAATHGHAIAASLPATSAALFVSDCSQPLTQSELTSLLAVSAHCAHTICVMPKADLYPEWRRVADINREMLADAGLTIDVVPVASPLRRLAIASSDAAMNDESGYSALSQRIEYDLVGRAEELRVASAVTQVSGVLDHVDGALQVERAALAHGNDELVAAVAHAHARSATLAEASARWSTVLNDQISDLTSNTDHELRMLTRSLIAEIDETIEANDPADIAAELIPMIEQQLFDDVAACHQRVNARAAEVADNVAKIFDADAKAADLASLDMATLAIAGEAAFSERELTVEERPGRGALLFTGVRGSYSGVAVFGMIFGFAGGAISAVALAPASLAAGAYFGHRTARQERDRMLKTRRQHARQDMRKAVDEVALRITKHTRDAIKAVHRDVRDANLTRARELQRTNAAALSAAQQALRSAETDAATRINEIDAARAQLTTIRTALATVSPGS